MHCIFTIGIELLSGGQRINTRLGRCQAVTNRSETSEAHKAVASGICTGRALKEACLVWAYLYATVSRNKHDENRYASQTGNCPPPWHVIS